MKRYERNRIFFAENRYLIPRIQFTQIDHLPLLSRCFEYLRRWLRYCFRFPAPSNYICHPNPSERHIGRLGNTGYLLIEFIEEAQGEMLSNTWSEKQHDIELRSNLFKDLSRILSVSAERPCPVLGLLS